MSGVEFVGLAFGVIPVVVEILKSYRTTRDRLSTFKRYAQVINDVQLRFRVSAANFSNECQLLLKVVVEDACLLSQMIHDPDHSSWTKKALEDRFRSFLERDYTLCEEIVLKIRDVLRETQMKLNEFDGSNDSNASGTTQRLRQAFNISRKENQFRQWIEDLDRWNAKLGNLRAQRCKLLKHRIYPLGCIIRKAEPQAFSNIRVASQSLYESLHDSWSCTNVSHTGHQAKLSLEAKADYGAVRLDMAIACQRRLPAASKSGAPPEDPIWLHVQSITMNAKPAVACSAQNNDTRSLVQTKIDAAKSLDEPSTLRAVKSGLKALKRVRFDGVSDDESCTKPKKSGHDPLSASAKGKPQSFAMLDLKATESICCHLYRTCSSTSSCGDPCLGYLERLQAAHSSRLIFYDASKRAAANASQPGNGRKALPISGQLQCLQTLHQLTLAHQIATAALQYYSTSWLPRDWSLHDVSYFTDESVQPSKDDLLKELQSLHLNTEFPTKSRMSTTQPEHNVDDLKYMYGIRNLTLAKLGVALLEIGLQKDISSSALGPIPHDVISARKLLLEGPSSLAMLGPRYFKIAKKCIECDFSCGDNLNETELQNAVYTDVVCGLEAMVLDWKKFLDIK